MISASLCLLAARTRDHLIKFARTEGQRGAKEAR
jgi:hypothetical protein